MTSQQSTLVGKRIIICNELKQAGDTIPWQSGIIRCTSSRNFNAEGFSVCVEWDEKSWECREWLHLHQLSNVLIEKHFTILKHSIGNGVSSALVFQLCRGDIVPSNHVLVEEFKDRRKKFVKESEVEIIEEPSEAQVQADVSVKDWVCSQKTQKILLEGCALLAGCRVLVYGGSSSLRWINAVVTKQLHDKQLSIMTEQVLTHTTVDPLTTQVRFLDIDVIDDVTNGCSDSSSRRSRRLSRMSSHNVQDPTLKRRSATKPSVEETIKATSALYNCESTQCNDVINKPVTSSCAAAAEQPTSEARMMSQLASEREEQSKILLKMQQSHQQALSNFLVQQALLQENEKRQSQTSPRPPQHIPPQILTANPYLSPYTGLQLLYSNQAALAQAQLQAAALAAAGGRAAPLMMPWLKSAQQGALDKEMQLSQQQAVYAALYNQKALDGIRDCSSLLRPEALLSSNSSPSAAPRTASPRREKPELLKSERDHINSPKEMLAKKLSHSPSPRLVADAPVGLLGYQQPRTEHHKSSPRLNSDSPLLRDRGFTEEELKRLDEERMKQLREVERENQRKEDSWKLKYFGGNHLPRSKNAEGQKEDMVEGVRTSNEKPPKSWSLDPTLTHTITHTPLGMIDPATYLAAHGAQFIRDDAVRQNGLMDKDPLKSRPPFVSASLAHSNKTWQPPVQISEAMRRRSGSPTSLPIGHTTVPARVSAPAATSPGQGKPLNSSVVNIHSLKYHPPIPTTKVTSQSPKPDKNVIVKTTPVPGNKEGQSVKYISDKTPLMHRPSPGSPSPSEQLGPMMADGSRARVLSPKSLKNLYHFPEPSSKSLAKVHQGSNSGNDAVIIKTGQYKVTEVHGGRESCVSIPTPSGGHLVYPKHAPSSRTEAKDPQPPSVLSVSDKSNRKRGVEEHEPEVNKKFRVKSPPPARSLSTQPSLTQSPSVPASHLQNLPQGNPPHLSRMSNFRDVTASTDPFLQCLVGAGVFPISGSNIIWSDSSRIGNEYPGAPTKVALKDALLGVKKENGLNLSTSMPAPDPPCAPPVSSPTRLEPLSLTSKVQPSTTASQPQTPVTSSRPINPAVNLLKPEEPVMSTLLPVSAPQPPVATTTSHPPTTTTVVQPPITSSAFLPSENAKNENSASLVEKPTASNRVDAPAVAQTPPAVAHPVQTPSAPHFANSPPVKCIGEDASSKLCPKLKKAWIKRSYQSDDAAKLKASTPLLSEQSIPLTELSDQDKVESDSASDSKKIKKKHKLEKEKRNKEVSKKKRKHKDKDGKRSKKNDCSSPESSDTKKDLICFKNGKNKSNSKLFLLGKLADDCTDTEDAEWRGKRRSAVQMPLGENGLPISVLLCRKEQSRLKKSGESFVQDAACHEIASMNGVSIQNASTGGSSLPKCRECRSAKRKENSAIFCRFYGFRKLAFVSGHLQASGFCDPEDSHVTDLALWLPATYKGNDISMTQRPVMELETCRYIMKHIGGKFCELVQEEREALQEAEKTQRISWKRPVPGVREMCDACETTLFNLHWVCQKCGFGICSDCYCARKAMSREDMEEFDNDKNNMYRWLKCGKGKHHLPSHLVPTQIIPSSCLFDLCDLAHQVRAKWNITSQCCKKSVAMTSSLLSSRANDPTPLLKNHCNSELLSQSGGKLTPPSKHSDSKHTLNREGPRLKGFDCDNSASPLDWLASIALREQRNKNSNAAPPSAKTSSIDEKVGKAVEKSAVTSKNPPSSSSSTAPRSWLCNGQLLQLTDSSSSVNVDTFQLHWFYGMPVMASGASSNLNRELWKPETFSAEHGEQPTGAALINCRKGSIITNALIRDFWNGFEKIENRLCDERTGEKMILKLKDWPTADDFIDTMPEKFDDLMRALPLPQYTAREGKFNMAAHLPDFFVRPDLGPKMYIAYGWVTERDWNQGTTNLHLDISDACNLMVYVGIPEDEPPESQEALIKIIQEGDADDAQIERARTLKPGALWHIFKAADTDKIRKLILKVKSEKGIKVSDDHDPIHDQQIYLDQGLRRRLREEYGVEGYPLVQCEGDSVFIPAGAPHQVFNLHSCIKVAEDFVSPEHVDKCFKLTEEFRHLSTTHSNHEDKLQLKNIIYHTMKEVVDAFHRHESVCDITSKPSAAQT